VQHNDSTVLRTPLGRLNNCLAICNKDSESVRCLRWIFSFFFSPTSCNKPEKSLSTVYIWLNTLFTTCNKLSNSHYTADIWLNTFSRLATNLRGLHKLLHQSGSTLSLRLATSPNNSPPLHLVWLNPFPTMRNIIKILLPILPRPDSTSLYDLQQAYKFCASSPNSLFFFLATCNNKSKEELGDFIILPISDSILVHDLQQT